MRIEREDDCLQLTVRDAGVVSRQWVPGVGLSSMRVRAAEVGGTVQVTTNVEGHSCGRGFASAEEPWCRRHGWFRPLTGPVRAELEPVFEGSTPSGDPGIALGCLG